MQPGIWKKALLLALLTLFLLAPGAYFAPLIDRDEPRFSQATREMMDRSDWIIPTFNHEYRFDKPPLTYWAMRVAYSLCGVNEWASRLHAIVATILIVLALYWIGSRWFGEDVGFLAGFVFLTSLQTLIHGRLALADAPMILAVVLSHYAIFQLLHRKERTKPFGPYFWLLYLSLAFGFLAKGPLVYLIPVATLLLHRFAFGRKPLPWKKLQLAAGLPLSLIPVAAWGIPALLRTHGAFWDVGIGEHIVHRGTDSFNGRHFFFLFYFLSIWISLFPWSGYAGKILSFCGKGKNAETSFLLSWLLGPIVIFSFYATQLPHYIMPGFPAFALLAGQALRDKECPNPKWGKILRIILIVLIGIPCALLFYLSFFQTFFPPFTPLKGFLLGLAFTLLGALLLAIRRPSPCVASAVPLLLLSLGFAYACRCLAPHLPAAQLAPLMRSMPAQTKFCGYHYAEPSLVFYSNRVWTFPSTQEALRTVAESPDPAFIIVRDVEYKIDRHYWPQLTGSPAPPPEPAPEIQAADALLRAHGFTLQTIDGPNIGRTTWVKLRVYTRE